MSTPPPTLDPYGRLEYSIGTDDDFVCFDYAVTNEGVWLASTINSETGSFIQAMQQPVIVPHNQALWKADAMIDQAWDWVMEQNFKSSERVTGRRDAKRYLRDLRQSLISWLEEG